MRINKFSVFFLAALPLNMALANSTALVSGFAQSFFNGGNIPDATITILENGQQLQTDQNGRFGPFHYPIGKPLTLVFNKSGYKTTQSDTMIVPKQGLQTIYDNPTFQIPSNKIFFLFTTIIGARINPDSCHMATTITAHHKTLTDIPQGEPGAIVILSPAVNVQPFYFDIFKSGLLKGKTNPFNRNLKATSEDGGVAFFNLPPSPIPYTITAFKNGVQFSSAQFICQKDHFINISPPRGPSVL